VSREAAPTERAPQLERLDTGRHRSLPPFERLVFANEWPGNATAEHRLDPVWIDFLKREGRSAVAWRIEQQRRSELRS
jgi:hypothetical protein